MLYIIYSHLIIACYKPADFFFLPERNFLTVGFKKKLQSFDNLNASKNYVLEIDKHTLKKNANLTSNKEHELAFR